MDPELQQSVKISLVVPMYNEEDTLEPFFSEVDKSPSLPGIYFETIWINDSSLDNTFALLSEWARPGHGIKLIKLSRNFGKEQKLTAELDYATEQAAISIDCGLQAPP